MKDLYVLMDWFFSASHDTETTKKKKQNTNESLQQDDWKGPLHMTL